MLGALTWAVVALLVARVCGDVVVYNRTTETLFIVDEFPDLQASFGGGLPMEGLRGLMVKGEPADGCSALAKPPLVPNYANKWIVLIARYNCNFEAKVRNAQAAGFDCAIVHNVNSSDLETMSANNRTGIFIPSVFVGSDAGEILPTYPYQEGYFIVVNGDLPFDVNTKLLLPFAIVVAICLVVMLVFLVVKCVNDRARARRHRLPSRALKKIPTCKFRKGDPYDMCAICLDEYQDGERLRVLPCAHAYHAKCIDPWLTQNRRVCPVCKRRVLAAGERRANRADRSDSDDSRSPLVDDDAAPPATQGGTFEPQRENPFVRAARFMSRLRRNRQTDPEEAATENNEEQATNNVAEDSDGDDTRPLLENEGRAQRARRPRRARRSRRARPSPSPAPLLRPAGHSINGGQGEIGVAALPAPAAPPQPDVSPHVRL